MKWPAAPADLLSEKTFLVIREDLHAGEGLERKLVASEKSNQGCDKGDAKPSVQESVGATPCIADTWPKMRKKRPKKMRATGFENSDSEEPRPATASLEAPLVLDPRLIDKLDMSLLKKESLCESLSRITLGIVRPRVTEITRNESPERSKPRARFASDLSHNESKSKTNSHESDAKRLDDNNNKNKQQQLSPLRSRSSRAVSSSDVALFTGLKKRGSPRASPPEPCHSCGRAAQPERLHSHPKSPSPTAAKEPPLLGSARSSPSVIPVRAASRSVRKPSARQLEQLQQRIPGNVVSSSPLAMESPRRKQAGQAADSKTSRSDEEKKENAFERPTSGEDKSSGSTGKRRPRSVTCYICGREFGSASFPIHEPKCLQKWERENKSLPISLRRHQPVRPAVPIDSEEWNLAAWELSQSLLVPCLKCKRTFLPDRLVVHEKYCRNQKGRGSAPISRSLAESTSAKSLCRIYQATMPSSVRIGSGYYYAKKLSPIGRSAYERRLQ